MENLLTAHRTEDSGCVVCVCRHFVGFCADTSLQSSTMTMDSGKDASHAHCNFLNSKRFKEFD